MFGGDFSLSPFGYNLGAGPQIVKSSEGWVGGGGGVNVAKKGYAPGVPTWIRLRR